jgi:hypothetical protein
MNRVLAAALATTCAVFCASGAAGQVTWQFTGIVDQGNRSGYFFPFAVAAGDPVTIDLSLEQSTPCSACNPTYTTYQDPLTAISFTANGETFDFPLSSSDLALTKDRAPGPGGKYFFNQFLLSFQGVDSASGIYYSGDLALQDAALMPPVPGINDVHLANLTPPDPAAFANPFLGVDTNFFDVRAAQGRGFNEFAGRTLSSSVAATPELDAASAGAALTLLLGSLAVLRGRRGYHI